MIERTIGDHAGILHNSGVAVARESLDVWLIPLDRPISTLRSLYELLSPDERARCARFHFRIHRARFVAAHATLRLILSRYVELSPHAIAFRPDANGKPELVCPGQARTPAFNLSHAASLAAVAVGHGADRVGVDIEELRGMNDALDMARHHFHPREAHAIAAFLGAERDAAFLRLWTRKEALHKADGRGLSLPLNTFVVDHALTPAHAEQVARRLGTWLVEDLRLPSGYVGALAYEGARRVVSLRSCRELADTPLASRRSSDQACLRNENI